MTILFWSSIALIVYTYAGYPLQLWLMARLRKREVARAPITPEVVMIVVGFNEAHRIEAKLHTCLQQDYPPDKLRVLFVSDGSTDATCEVVQQFPDSRVRLLSCPERRGKAACLNDGVAETTEPIIVFTDARQRLHPQALSRLVANFADANIGAVSGELVFESADGTAFAEGIGAYWLYEKFIRSREALTGSVVGVTGALYAIRRVCFHPIPHETILDDVAIPMRAAMDGWRISFENGALAYDQPSTDAQREKIRKVRTLAGNFQLPRVVPGVLKPWRNPIWGRFMAHKMLRLLCPLAMAVALVSNIVLTITQGGLYSVLAGAQLAGYLAIGVALIVPALQRLAVLRLGVTFAHLNIFVVLGFMSFMSQKQSPLWGSSTTLEQRHRAQAGKQAP
jgi:poly-beta-1,6-N-acetyl-D-glucosamine synthase